MTATASRRRRRGLRLLIGESDAVLFCSPEYAETLPGSLKNLLDWTVGGGEFDRKLAAGINVAAPGRGKGAEDSLMAVLGYVGADIVEAACRQVPVDRDAIGPDGTVIGLKFAVEIAEVWDALLAHLGQALTTPAAETGACLGPWGRAHHRGP